MRNSILLFMHMYRRKDLYKDCQTYVIGLKNKRQVKVQRVPDGSLVVLIGGWNECHRKRDSLVLLQTFAKTIYRKGLAFVRVPLGEGWNRSPKRKKCKSHKQTYKNHTTKTNERKNTNTRKKINVTSSTEKANRKEQAIDKQKTYEHEKHKHNGFRLQRSEIRSDGSSLLQSNARRPTDYIRGHMAITRWVHVHGRTKWPLATAKVRQESSRVDGNGDRIAEISMCSHIFCNGGWQAQRIPLGEAAANTGDRIFFMITRRVIVISRECRKKQVLLFTWALHNTHNKQWLVKTS